MATRADELRRRQEADDDFFTRNRNLIGAAAAAPIPPILGGLAYQGVRSGRITPPGLNLAGGALGQFAAPDQALRFAQPAGRTPLLPSAGVAGRTGLLARGLKGGLPGIAGEFGAVGTEALFGGPEQTEESGVGQFLRGAFRGGGAGASAGLMGGPLAPISVPVGAAAGGLIGGAADLLDVPSRIGNLFGGGDDSESVEDLVPKFRETFGPLGATTAGAEAAIERAVAQEELIPGSVLPSRTAEDAGKELSGEQREAIARSMLSRMAQGNQMQTTLQQQLGPQRVALGAQIRANASRFDEPLEFFEANRERIPDHLEPLMETQLRTLNAQQNNVANAYLTQLRVPLDQEVQAITESILGPLPGQQAQQPQLDSALAQQLGMVPQQQDIISQMLGGQQGPAGLQNPLAGMQTPLNDAAEQTRYLLGSL